MYRGRPPPRGGYPPPCEGRGPPPPGRSYPPPYREDRGRPRPPFHHGYQDHRPPDSYRRSPTRRRYPSPGPGSHRGGEYWGSGPRERSPSPRVGLPVDHKLVITVGNELTGPGASHSPYPPHDRDYLSKSGHDGLDDRGSRRRSRSRGRSRPRSRSRSPDRSRALSLGRSKSRPRSRSHSPDRSRAKSRGRSKSRAHSRSPERTRAKSRGRSKSRAHSRSPERTRAKSRGRSKSRAHSRSPERMRAKSRGRSKSRAQSRSRSRSRSRLRPRSSSRGRSYGHGRSRSRSLSTSSSRSSSRGKKRAIGEFQELDLARRRKEMEEILCRPTKSILKKRLDSEDSPTVMSSDSPRGLDGASMSRVAERFLTAVKGMEPHMLASMLAELRQDPQMAQRAGLDEELTGILSLLGGSDAKPEDKSKDDIDDEEKFLYGDEDDDARPVAPSEPEHQRSISDLYGDVTEDALYGDYPQQHAPMTQPYSVQAAASAHHPAHPGLVDLPSRDCHLPQQVDMRYESKSTITPDQNIKVEVPNPAYPPGTGLLDEKERQDVEEYEKIQDLLKTIGLDLGVTEISKMAARTKERLQGSTPAPKTPTHRPERRSRHDSSGSSDRSHYSGRRRHSSHSGSRSSASSSSRSRSGSWSSDGGQKSRRRSPPSQRRSTHGKSQSVKEVKSESRDWGLPAPDKTVPQTSPDLTIISPHPPLPVPPFPSQGHGMLPPGYPPPSYGNYMPYIPPQQWPPMYPPPGMGIQPQASHDYPKTSPYDRQYQKGSSKSAAQDSGKESSKVSSREKTNAEEKNNESQKQKVLEERENLKHDRDLRMKKKEYLMKELERLRKQQGELLRKKRREKDGHKDPLLSEIGRLQEEVMSQIAELRKDHEVAEAKRKEIEKVAMVLGLTPSDRPRKVNKILEDQGEEQQKKLQRARNAASADYQLPANTMSKSEMSSSRASPEKAKQIVHATAPTTASVPDPFEYYDAGNHWCKNCNITSGSMFDFFTHLHSKSHRKTQDPYERPWAASSSKTANLSSDEKLTKPAKGSEFLLPVRGYFCLLCREFYGDAICAEEHVTTHAHNEKYKKQICENPLYEQRRNLDRQAGLGLESSGKKRKHEDSDGSLKEKEEKPKHKKEKRDKEKREDKEEKKDEKPKPKKEETHRQIEREEKFLHSIQDGEERYKYSKKEDSDRNRYVKEEEEKEKYSKREEDDRYKYGREEENRYRYHREEEDERFRYRNEDRFKHGWRDEDKYRYNRTKYDRKEEERFRSEKIEGKSRNEVPDKQLHKPDLPKEQEKPVPKKPPGPPPKPYDPPKVLCGPSPAMRAKLRKQSAETIKAAPTETAKTSQSTFGKFTWKKKENVLAKEAERVAAEFLKDDEVAASQPPIPPEDSFAKSMAVAKEIALKLTGPNVLPPHWVSRGSIRGRIRPNLPAPPAVFRKPSETLVKPAPLNTFLSIRPQAPSVLGPPQIVNPTLAVTPEPINEPLVCSDVTSRAFGSEEMPSKDVSEVNETAAIESMITIESDVAVPGVPASEQKPTVYVKPPPFMNAGDGAQKSDKPKSNLAAAKAQDLFDLFYSTIGQSAPSAVTKPTADVKGAGPEPKKRVTKVPQTLETQPASQTKPHAQSLSVQAEKPDSSLPSEAQPGPRVEPICSDSAPQNKQPQLKVSPDQPRMDSQSEPNQPAQISQAQSKPESVPKPAPVKCLPHPDAQSAESSTETKPVQSQPTPPAEPQSQPAPANQIKPQSAPDTQPQSSVETEPPPPEPTPAVQSDTQPTPAVQSDTQPTPAVQSDTQPTPAVQSDTQPSPKTKSKKSPQAKTTPSSAPPVRQTRSQTRYQTRQKKSRDGTEPPSEPISENTEEITEPAKESESQSEGAKQEVSPADKPDDNETVTPETLGLPSEIMCLGFDYDFNFE